MACSELPAGRCVHLTRERKTLPDTAKEHSGLQHSPFRRASQQWFQPGRDTTERGWDGEDDRKAELPHGQSQGAEQRERERKGMKEQLRMIKSLCKNQGNTYKHTDSSSVSFQLRLTAEHRLSFDYQGM